MILLCRLGKNLKEVDRNLKTHVKSGAIQGYNTNLARSLAKAMVEQHRRWIMNRLGFRPSDI